MKNKPEKNKKKEKSDLFVRLRTGAVYAIIVLIGSLCGNIATTIMLSLAAGISAYEFYLMLRSDAKLPNETLGIIAAVAYPASFYLFKLEGVVFVTIVFILSLMV